MAVAVEESSPWGVSFWLWFNIKFGDGCVQRMIGLAVELVWDEKL